MNMGVSKGRFFIIFVFFTIFQNIRSYVRLPEDLADWTLFVYMESDKDLNDAAFKNLTDIVRAGVPDNINVVVQLHAWQETAWRYKISGNSITLDSIINLTLDPEQDLANGLSWAFTNYPAKKIMTVLWNHGFGILDPVWSEHEEGWLPENLQDMKTTRSKLLTDIFEHKKHKGVLFYPCTRVFLTNSGMINAFSKVKNEILCGKKIDIISADACKMAMIEIAYQLSDFGDYFIGSQDCELKDGCDYFSLVKQLSLNSCPKDVAVNIVRDYENYYKPRAACGRYTQSAIDLNFAREFVESLDNLVSILIKIDDFKSKNIICEIIQNSRKIMPEFCSMPSYVDIYSFFKALKDNIKTLGLPGEASGHTELLLNLIRTLIDRCLLVLDKVVIANVSGFKSCHAQGLSIYYPYDYKKGAYSDCLFASRSLWIKFLNSFAVNRAF